MIGAASTRGSARTALRGAFSRALLIGIALGLSVTGVMPPSVHAAFKGCIANITPNTASVGTTTAFTVTVTNGTSLPIQWLRAAVPSDNYQYQNSIVSGNWLISDAGDGTLLAGGDEIGVGQTWSFDMVVNLGVQNSGPDPWSVEVASDPDGQGIRTCTGSLNTTVSGQLPQDQVNGVSNISVSGISTDTVTISWDTDNLSTGMVYYGQTESYGQNTPLNSQYTFHHEVLITGLSANTTYHYQVVGTDSNGGYAYSIDNTFMTASTPIVAPPPGQSINGALPSVASTSRSLPQVSSAIVRADKDAPTITITTALTGSYAKSPAITGFADDAVAVGMVEYSVDNGKNWLPVDVVSRNDTHLVFSFTPLIASDGNYIVLVRVSDLAGHTTASAAQTLIIDQLPPLVGGSLLMAGPDTVRPSQDGLIETVIGQELRLVTSVVGGPTAITAEGISVDDEKVAQSFSLTESSDRSMWSGSVDFIHPGTYHLVIKSTDGADNHDQKTIATVHVAPAARIVDAATASALAAAKVTVEYRDPDTGTWVLWDAEQYDQQNPRSVAGDGTYSLFLPAGTYYLKFQARGYSETNTESFTLLDPTVVSTNVSMHKRPGLHIGTVGFTMPWVETGLIKPQFGSKRGSIGAVQSPMVGRQLPTDLQLQLVDGSDLSQTELFGRPSVLTFVSTWAPAAQDQLAILDSVDSSLVNVYVIDSGESAAKADAYMRIAGYDLPVIQDSQNKIAAAFDAPSLPTTYFLDRHGTVQHVVTGVLSKEALLQYAVD